MEPEPERSSETKKLTHKPWMRDHKCRRIDWEHENITKNTIAVINAHKNKFYTEEDIKMLWERQVNELDQIIRLNEKKLVFRGMNLDFFNSLKGFLAPKCLECDTSIKYHIREGNSPNAVVHEDCEVPELGTGTNYLSWSDNYRICIKYALTGFDFKTKIKYASDIGILMIAETVNERNYDWFYPAGNSTWAESVSTDKELEIDDAYNKPMIMLADWSSYDGEYLLKTDKPIRLDDKRFKYLYIKSTLIPIGYQSETIGLPALRTNNISKIRKNDGFIYKFYNPEFKGIFGLTFYDKLTDAQKCNSTEKFIAGLPEPIQNVLDERTSVILSSKGYNADSSENELGFQGFSKRKTKKSKSRSRRKTKKRKSRRSRKTKK